MHGLERMITVQSRSLLAVMCCDQDPAAKYVTHVTRWTQCSSESWLVHQHTFPSLIYSVENMTELFMLLLRGNIATPTRNERSFLLFLSIYSLPGSFVLFWSCDLHGGTALSRYCIAGNALSLFNKPKNCPSQPFFLSFKCLQSLSRFSISQQTHFGFRIRIINT
jgi:hypothetical protein